MVKGKRKQTASVKWTVNLMHRSAFTGELNSSHHDTEDGSRMPPGAQKWAATLPPPSWQLAPSSSIKTTAVRLQSRCPRFGWLRDGSWSKPSHLSALSGGVRCMRQSKINSRNGLNLIPVSNPQDHGKNMNLNLGLGRIYSWLLFSMHLTDSGSHIFRSGRVI